MASPKSLGRYDAVGDPRLDVAALRMNEPFKFDGDFARRLLRREVNAKEACTVMSGGKFYRASVKELTAGGGVAVPYEECATPEPSIDLTLACAVLARQRMIFVVQKATELGVSRIVPLLTEHSVQADGLEHEKAHAWPGQIIRAAKQCRRSSLPELLPPMKLNAFLASEVMASTYLALTLDNTGTTSKLPDDCKRVVLIVGPEGGFSERERKEMAPKAKSLVLGGRVLRAETAVLAGLTAVQLKFGDFR